MKNSLEARLGIFFALVVIAVFVLLEVTGGLDFFRGGMDIRAQFNSVQDLKPGDPVKMGGVPIGRVSKISLEEGRVEVVLSVREDARLRTDSTAVIQFTGLLGQNFVSIDFGSPEAPLLAKNALIATKEQPDLASILKQLDGVADGVQNMTKSFSGEEFSKLLGPLTDLVRENQPRITDILENVRVVSGQVAQGEGTIGKLIRDDTFYTSALGAVTNLNSITSDAQGMLMDAEALFADARHVMAGVRQGDGSVGKLLLDDTLANELITAATSLREILGKINSGQGSVGMLVNDASFLRNVKLTLQKVDKATEGLEDAGPLNFIGTAVQTLF